MGVQAFILRKLIVSAVKSDRNGFINFIYRAIWFQQLGSPYGRAVSYAD